MDPIQDISELHRGDVIHHPALGFAVVDQLDGGSARLAWEQSGARLPPMVSAELLAKGYRRCVPCGFLHQSVIDKNSIRVLVETEPANALRLLLDDLQGEQRRSDIRDWMTGRELMSSAHFDRWWSTAEDEKTGHQIVWSNDNTTVSLTADPKTENPESFLQSTPRIRWSIAESSDQATRTRLLHQAITARDNAAILLLLRIQEAIDDTTLDALRKIARSGNHAVTAALLDRGDEAMLKTLVGPASWENTRDRVQAAIDRLPPSRRLQVAVEIIDQALTMEGDPPAASWLASVVPGGDHALLATAKSMQGAAKAVDWLTGRTEEESLMDTITDYRSRDTVEFSVRPSAAAAQLIANLRDIAAERLLPLSTALAKALAQRHAMGEAGGITGARVDAAGTVTLGPPEERDREEDVRDAMRMLLETAVGPLPADSPLPDSDLLPHIHQLRSDLPSDWVAIVMESLAQETHRRPCDGIQLWEKLAAATARFNVRSEMPPVHRAVDIAHDTHIGLNKSRRMQTNQDAVYYAQSDRCSVMLVADGISVSSAGSGNLASALLVQTVANLWERDQTRLATMNQTDVIEWLREALAQGNSNICETSLQLANGDLSQQIPMGTTALLALVRDSVLYLAALGDSRAYLVGESGVSLLTGDQNVRGLWLCAHRTGGPLPDVANEGFALVGYCGRFDDQARPSPADPVVRTVPMFPGETLLLCSDGLTDYAAGTLSGQSAIVAEGAQQEDLWLGCRWLVNKANEGGGGDNITVLLARLL